MGGRKDSKGTEGVRPASKSTIEINFYWHGRRCKPRIKAKPTPANLLKAEQFRSEVIEAIKDGSFDWSVTFPDTKNPFAPEKPLTIGPYLEEWIDNNEKHFSSSTVNGYRKIIAGHLVPAFGKIHLYELRLKHIRDYVSSLDITPKTIGNIISPLRAALDDAVSDELLHENPIANFKIKRRRGKARKRNRDIDPFTHDERQAILGKLTGQGKNLIKFAFFTGLRTSELVALDWEDIDFIRGVVYVTKALTQAASEPEEPKTSASEREVKLLPEALSALNDQKSFTFLKGEEIFQNPRTEERWTGDQPIRKTLWQPALKRAGVRYRRPYQTRHSYASMLLTDGERIQWVSRQLGHTDWAFTARTYAAYIPEDDPHAGNKTTAAHSDRMKSDAG